MGTGPVGFGGAACASVFGEGAGEAGFSGDDWTLEGMGSPAAGFDSPLGGGGGDLMSSDIANEAADLRRRGRLEER